MEQIWATTMMKEGEMRTKDGERKENMTCWCDGTLSTHRYVCTVIIIITHTHYAVHTTTTSSEVHARRPSTTSLACHTACLHHQLNNVQYNTYLQEEDKKIAIIPMHTTWSWDDNGSQRCSWGNEPNAFTHNNAVTKIVMYVYESNVLPSYFV